MAIDNKKTQDAQSASTNTSKVPHTGEPDKGKVSPVTKPGDADKNGNPTKGSGPQSHDKLQP